MRVRRSGMSMSVLLGAIVGLLCIASIPVTPTARAAEFSPTNTAELISAIEQANQSVEADIIRLTPGTTYLLDDVMNNAGLPDIASEIRIVGNGATIARDPNAGPLRIFYITSSGDLTLENVTISGGQVTNGGGIHNYHGDLTLIDSHITGNDVTGVGGGVYAEYGTLTVMNSVISGNTAGSGGAGISGLAATMTVTDSTILDNHAVTAGGGISVSAGSLNLSNSTMSGNTAGSYGGGAITSYAGSVIVTNSTLTGNSAGLGGAIRTYLGNLTLLNTTVSGNTATTAGGGVYTYDSTVVSNNSIVAANGAPTEVDMSNLLKVASGGNNLIGSSAGVVGLTNGVNGNKIGTPGSPLNPLLGQLADNGGSTLTMAPLNGSQAINAGNDALAPVADQRGIARPFGAASDIGAVEFAISHDDLCDLTRQYINRESVANTACTMLGIAATAKQNGNTFMEQTALSNYRLQIQSAMGRRYVSTANGNELIALSQML